MRVLDSIRGRIIVPCILFTILLLSVFLLTFSILTSRQLVSNLSQSSAYNLELISNFMEEELKATEKLLGKISTNDTILNAFSSYNKQTFLAAFDVLSESVQSSSVYNLVDRAIVSNNEMTIFMQYGQDTSTSHPLTSESLKKEINSDAIKFDISKSSLSFYNQDSIKFIVPLESYHENSAGFVYIAIDAKELFRACFSYDMPTSDSLELAIGDFLYKLENGNFNKIDSSQIDSKGKEIYYSWFPNNVSAIKYRDGLKSYIAVTISLPVFEISISQIIPVDSFVLTSRQYWSILLAILVATTLLGVLLWLTLNKVVYKPIKKLSDKLEKISKEDFSIDKSLETEDEFGQMGKMINTLSENVVALMDAKVQDEKHKQELEYKMLQNQINPHFIYNTLNIIKWMATIQKAQGIAEMTTSLSRMMKTISKGEGGIVSLKEELDFISEYITIMRYRYASNIEFILKIEPCLLSSPIPRFTLQPIIENAIFHGITPKGKGTIAIIAKKFGTSSIIMIADNGIGFDANMIDDKKSNGVFKQIGISNIKKRLSHVFEDNANLEIKSWPGVGTAVYIKLPFSEDNDEL